MRAMHWIFIGLAAAVATQAAAQVTLMHVHGLAYSPDGKRLMIPVHPGDAAIAAAATSSGVFLSRDSGERFVRLAGGAEGLSVHFDLDGKSLWYGTFDGRARLARAPLDGGTGTPVDLPALGQDAVA